MKEIKYLLFLNRNMNDNQSKQEIEDSMQQELVNLDLLEDELYR
jgi:hypothetical protein